MNFEVEIDHLAPVAIQCSSGYRPRYATLEVKLNTTNKQIGNQ